MQIRQSIFHSYPVRTLAYIYVYVYVFVYVNIYPLELCVCVLTPVGRILKYPVYA